MLNAVYAIVRILDSLSFAMPGHKYMRVVSTVLLKCLFKIQGSLLLFFLQFTGKKTIAVSCIQSNFSVEIRIKEVSESIRANMRETVTKTIS